MLLERALTRKAFANEQAQRGISCEDQEIFCTLGDAVLKTVLIDILIRNGVATPDMITRKKIELEREENLAAIGREIQIGPYITSVRERPNIMQVNSHMSLRKHWKQ